MGSRQKLVGGDELSALHPQPMTYPLTGFRATATQPRNATKQNLACVFEFDANGVPCGSYADEPAHGGDDAHQG